MTTEVGDILIPPKNAIGPPTNDTCTEGATGSEDRPDTSTTPAAMTSSSPLESLLRRPFDLGAVLKSNDISLEVSRVFWVICYLFFGTLEEASFLRNGNSSQAEQKGRVASW